MFGKKKQEQQEQKLTQEDLQKEKWISNVEIRTMPGKFRKPVIKSSGSKGLKILILVVVLVVIVVGIAYGMYAYINSTQKQLTPQQNTNQQSQATQTTNQQPQENINSQTQTESAQTEDQKQEVEAEVDTTETDSDTEPTNQNQNVNAITNQAEENQNQASSLPATVAAKEAVDTDKDGLTDFEEDLFQTERRKPDTDNDGYPDGNEVLGGFNPKEAGGSLLVNSSVVNLYTNPLFNYKLLMPSAWLARPVDESLQEVMFISSTRENMEVIVQENIEDESLLSWYLKQNPDLNPNEVNQTKTTNGYNVIFSVDNMTYFIVDPQNPEYIYALTYSLGQEPEMHFKTVLKMMLNSFQITGSVSDSTGLIDTVNQ